MRLFRSVYALALMGFLGLGCPGSTPVNINASDFNQTCKVAADCMLIDEGSSCCGSCGNAAINIADKAKYEAAAQQRANSCTQPVACAALACVFSTAFCNAGKCDVCHEPGCPASTTDGGIRD